MNKDLNCNSKTVVYLIECKRGKEINTESTQTLNTRMLLHKRDIKITENRILDILKHLYKCSQGILKVCLYNNLTTTHYST